MIISSLDEIESISCIRFVFRTKQNDYFEMVTGSSCSSQVGRVGGRQIVTLNSPGCMSKGIIIHEILHVLGFWHMQSDFQRDEFVRVNFENVQANLLHNFDKRNTDRLGTPYDFGSVMHYGAYFFSRNGRPTIEPLFNSIPISSIGQRIGMSNGDIARLNRLYEC